MIEMARERFQEGVKYYDTKQYEKARVAFLQAYALKRHPAVLLNLAQSELRSGRDADAAKHFDLYLRENKEASALEKQEAEKGLMAAKAKVGTVEIRVDDGAEIFVDGQPEGRSPLAGPLYLSPGNHTIEGRKAGQVASAKIDAAAGRTATATLSFGESGGAAAGAVPASGTDPAPAAGGGDAPSQAETTEVGFDTSEPREPFFDWAKRNKVAWVGAGVTVLGIAGAIGFSLTAKNRFDQANDIKEQIKFQATQDNVTNPCGAPPTAEYVVACDRFSENDSAGTTFETLTYVSIGLAVVAAGGTIVYYFLDSKKKPEAKGPGDALRVAIVPEVAPSAGGLSVIGSF